MKMNDINNFCEKYKDKYKDSPYGVKPLTDEDRVVLKEVRDIKNHYYTNIEPTADDSLKIKWKNWFFLINTVIVINPMAPEARTLIEEAKNELI